MLMTVVRDFPKRPLGSSLIERYLTEVEPYFRWHYSGPYSREPLLVHGMRIKTGSHDDNLPADWKWRRYVVKDSADWRCINCGTSKNLEADHIVRLSDWRSDDIEDFDTFDYEAPHSFKNLRCLCHDCHKRVTDGEDIFAQDIDDE